MPVTGEMAVCYDSTCLLPHIAIPAKQPNNEILPLAALDRLCAVAQRPLVDDCVTRFEIDLVFDGGITLVYKLE